MDAWGNGSAGPGGPPERTTTPYSRRIAVIQALLGSCPRSMGCSPGQVLTSARRVKRPVSVKIQLSVGC